MDQDAINHSLQLLGGFLRSIKHMIDDPSVTEIMINRPDDVWCNRYGKMERTDAYIGEIELRSALATIAGVNDKGVALTFDARLPGIRVAAALHPVAIHGHSMCIRKHMQRKMSLDDYVRQGAFDFVEMTEDERAAEMPPYDKLSAGGAGVAEFIRWLVLQRKNILVAGATDSGKTTLMNAILAEIPDSDRLLVVEDTSELNISVPNFVQLETAPDHDVDIRRLIKLCLRYRPDRIVVGEIRDAAAYDMMDALNTGHPGGCCSMHADSAVLALTRLESMVRMAKESENLPLDAMRRQIASAFQYVIFASRKFGVRAPEEIIRVDGVAPDGQYLFERIFSKQIK